MGLVSGKFCSSEPGDAWATGYQGAIIGERL
jgi:hypothetical protein